MAIELSEWDSAKPTESKPGSAAAATVDARERHKLAERERRKSMRELFLSLHSLLPHAAAVRQEQSAILDEIIKYIPLAAAHLRSLQNRRDSPSHHQVRHRRSGGPAVHVSERYSGSSDSGDCDIRVATDGSSSVAIRLRGDRANVSLSDAKSSSQALLLSAVYDELETHHLQVVRSTHCRDGTKLLHHTETKIRDGLDRSPALIKERLQDLACKLHQLRKSSSHKRKYDQIS